MSHLSQASLQKRNSILVISDIHYQLSNIKRLHKRYSSGFDYIFCLGDIGNLKGDQFNSNEEIEKAKNKIKEILNELEGLVVRKMIVLLGNHDHFSMLDEPDRWNTDKTVLLHGALTAQEIDSRTLFPTPLFVHGGSPPGYFLADHDKPRIKGYPFETRQEFNNELDMCMKGLDFANSVSRRKQTIWLTHCGPTESESSVTLIANEGAVESGSERYQYWLRKWQDAECEVLAWIHGHCHDGAGTNFTCEGVPVYNGAAFINGNYITMNLVEESQEKQGDSGEECVRWKLENVQLCNLQQE
mmetsp:Transcript_11674/g.43893  ORF Transcript_11674/g.43893 Transcript_11674/m.43893 type:complete len:300 (+) Transcript_11674:2145-3044(+)